MIPVEKYVPHILVVDDDRRLRGLLERYLLEHGYRVTQAKDAAEAKAKWASITFDLIVMDIMMPGESGLELTQFLRKKGNVPILLLSAMGEPGQRIAGLESGADDYLPKPFEPRELLLRIQAILKRVEPIDTLQGQDRGVSRDANSGWVKFGPYLFDLERKRLSKAGEIVHLTESEAELLFQLARRAGTVVAREELASQNSGDSEGENRQIDVQVNRLRRKIEDDSKFPRYLQTLRGRGYILYPD